MVFVLLSSSAKRFSVSRMRDFFKKFLQFNFFADPGKEFIHFLNDHLSPLALWLCQAQMVSY